ALAGAGERAKEKPQPRGRGKWKGGGGGAAPYVRESGCGCVGGGVVFGVVGDERLGLAQRTRS
ncbi:hypothetical protein, partial [Pseudomonas syringae group genomosp. 7]|uniref:hypothetical protein n=1 Tax=Pseudomonas syringae group genomosp. 7 TaxID=251699 RepID=UPI00376F7D22